MSLNRPRDLHRTGDLLLATHLQRVTERTPGPLQLLPEGAVPIPHGRRICGPRLAYVPGGMRAPSVHGYPTGADT